VSISLKQDGDSVSGGPFSTLNFENSLVINEGSGEATIASTVGHISIAAFGANGSGNPIHADENVDAFKEAIAAATAFDGLASVFVPPGVYYLDASEGTQSIYLEKCRNVRLWGIPGRSILKHVNDVAATNGLCYMLRISGCENITVDGLTFDGNWGNWVAEVAPDSHLDTTDAAEIYVHDLDEESYVDDVDPSTDPEVPVADSFQLATDSGIETIAYGGIDTDPTSGQKSFTSCTGGSSAVMRTGHKIGKFQRFKVETRITTSGLPFPLSDETLVVEDGSNLPTEVDGQRARVLHDNEYLEIWWESRVGNTLEHVFSDGGTGTLAANTPLDFVDGAGKQKAADVNTMQPDPKNHAIFVYGSTNSSNSAPNRNINIVNCIIYGDGIWLGNSQNVTVRDTRVRLTCRNGITLSNGARDLTFDNVHVAYASTTALDAEPVDVSTSNVRIDKCTFHPNWNTHNTSGNIVFHVQGGSHLHAAEWNYASNWRITDSTFLGSVMVQTARDVHFTGCTFSNDIPGTSFAPLVIETASEDIWVQNCHLFGNGAHDVERNKGVVSIAPYRYGDHNAASPSRVNVRGGSITARNGMAGAYIGACGGYPGIAAGTPTDYNPPTDSPPVDGELVFAGTPFAGKENFFIGHKVLMGDAVAVITDNDDSSLKISPVARNYADGRAWFDRKGRPVDDPSYADAFILPTGGFVSVEDVTIDCARSDDDLGGARGILFDTTSTWNAGYEDVRVSLRRNTILGADDAGIEAIVTGPGARWIEVVDNKIIDDQAEKTTEVGVRFTGAEYWERITLHGNQSFNGLADDAVDSITPVTGLEDTYWTAGSSYPPTFAGNVDPENLIVAPQQSTYFWLSQNETMRKFGSDGTSEDWRPVMTWPPARLEYRSSGEYDGIGSDDYTVPLTDSVDGDIEILRVFGGNPSVTLSVDGGFQLIGSEVSTYSPYTVRMTMYWRRVGTTRIAPVIQDASTVYTADIHAFKGCVRTGNPIDVSLGYGNTDGAAAFSAPGPTSSTNNALVVSFVSSDVASSPSSNLSGAANSSLTDLVEHCDRYVDVDGDRWLSAVVSGRKATAGSTGTLSGTVYTTGFAMTTVYTIVLKPEYTG
jgi:hypothetical protein